MEEQREVLTLEPMAEDPEVGRWLSAMQDARRDTLRELDGLPVEALDWRPEGTENSIGTLLYHIALIEADWLLDDILEGPPPPDWLIELLPYSDRDEAGLLTKTAGMTLDQHLDRLATVRSWLLDQLGSMSGADFHRIRGRERYDVSPDWVLHHLLQHEAEHRAQIARLREARGGRA